MLNAIKFLVGSNNVFAPGTADRYLGYTFVSRKKQSRKYLIGRSYKNDEFDWPFLLVTV